jgi:hypothetical protein
MMLFTSPSHVSVNRVPIALLMSTFGLGMYVLTEKEIVVCQLIDKAHLFA